MLNQLREDVRCILERDPAARSHWEVLTCYPGLHAILLHRLAHATWKIQAYWLARFIAYIARALTGIEIHPAATVGHRVFIDHGHGVVIGETAVIGDDCTIYQGVTLGGTALFRGEKRHPTLEAGVIVGAGAKILGGFTIGTGAKVGSNAVVLKEVPAGAVVVGNPARLIIAASSNPRSLSDLSREAGQHESFSAYGVTSGTDDPLIQAMHLLIDQVAQQEQQIQELRHALAERGVKFVHDPSRSFDSAAVNKLVE